ncbi:30S ribosome-binding factor RbfA [bacterium]|nr:MAG: 30S ribosome-binding factor RbfA [bacterium]
MSIRTRKVGREIRRIISELLEMGEIHDPRLSGMVTITGVDVSTDLKSAHVFYSCFGSDNEIESTGRALESASGYIQSEVGEKLGTKFTPKLIFELDKSIAYGDRIERIIEDLEEDEPEQQNNSNNPQR